MHESLCCWWSSSYFWDPLPEEGKTYGFILAGAFFNEICQPTKKAAASQTTSNSVSQRSTKPKTNTHFLEPPTRSTIPAKKKSKSINHNNRIQLVACNTLNCRPSTPMQQLWLSSLTTNSPQTGSGGEMPRSSTCAITLPLTRHTGCEHNFKNETIVVYLLRISNNVGSWGPVQSVTVSAQVNICVFCEWQRTAGTWSGYYG